MQYEYAFEMATSRPLWHGCDAGDRHGPGRPGRVSGHGRRQGGQPLCDLSTKFCEYVKASVERRH